MKEDERIGGAAVRSPHRGATREVIKATKVDQRNRAVAAERNRVKIAGLSPETPSNKTASLAPLNQVITLSEAFEYLQKNIYSPITSALEYKSEDIKSAYFTKLTASYKDNGEEL